MFCVTCFMLCITCNVLCVACNAVLCVMLWPGPAEVFATPRLLFAMFLHRRGHHCHPPLGQRPGDTHRKHQSYQDVNVSGALQIYMNNEYNTLEPPEAKASHESLSLSRKCAKFHGVPPFYRPTVATIFCKLSPARVSGWGGGRLLTHTPGHQYKIVSYQN